MVSFKSYVVHNCFVIYSYIYICIYILHDIIRSIIGICIDIILLYFGSWFYCDNLPTWFVKKSLS